jgi:hypothetical protein
VPETRVIANEALFRSVNEHVKEANDRLLEGASDSELDYLDFVCECGAADCVEHVQLTAAEYEEVRSEPRRFAVVPGHENPLVETVVWRTERFLVVRKRVGEEYLEATDPRTD